MGPKLNVEHTAEQTRSLLNTPSSPYAGIPGEKTGMMTQGSVWYISAPARYEIPPHMSGLLFNGRSLMIATVVFRVLMFVEVIYSWHALQTHKTKTIERWCLIGVKKKLVDRWCTTWWLPIVYQRVFSWFFVLFIPYFIHVQ